MAIDSGFAMAWRKLAVLTANQGVSEAREAAAATRAYQHRDRLPTVERNLAIAYYHGFVERDPGKVIAAHRAVLEADPENLIALNNQSIVLSDLRRYAEAETLANKATQLGRGTSFYLNTMAAQLAQGRLAEAQATADRYSASAPTSPFAETLQAAVAISRRDFREAERRLKGVRQKFPDSRFLDFVTARSLSTLYQREGRIVEAKRYLREHMAALEKGGSPMQYLSAAAGLAELELRYGQNRDSAGAVLAAALRRHPLASLDPVDRPYSHLIRANALLGRLDEAARLQREYLAQVPEGIRRGRPMNLSASGDLAWPKGRTRKRWRLYREWLKEDGACKTCGSYELGELYDRQGQADSAIAAFRRVADEIPTFEAARLVDGYAYAPSLKRLGELSEARGDRRKAADYYNRFVDLWKNADPPLQPAVREVRARLAQLAREPGG